MSTPYQRRLIVMRALGESMMAGAEQRLRDNRCGATLIIHDARDERFTHQLHPAMQIIASVQPHELGEVLGDALSMHLQALRELHRRAPAGGSEPTGGGGEG